MYSAPIIIYLILVISIGYFSGRKQNSNDFMMANRQLDLWSFVGSTTASMVGGGFLVVYTAYVYEFGIWTLSGIIGLFLGYLLFGMAARPLRKLAYENDFHTLADYFHFKFDKKTGHFIAFMISGIFIIWIINQFIASTQILSALSGYSYEKALSISAGVMFLYLVLGGFKSVIRTDVFQYLILLFLIFVLGINMVQQSPPSITELTQQPANISLAISLLIYGILIVWHSADIWQRIYAAKNDQVVKRGMILSGVFLVIIGLGISLIAYSTRFSFPNLDPSHALVYGLKNMISPSILSFGVILMFAAIMSSADSMTFVLASNFAKDLMPHIKKRKLKADELRFYTRIGLIIVITGGVTGAYFLRDIIDMALILAGLGMAITPAIIGSLKYNLRPHAIIGSCSIGLLYVIKNIVQGNINPESMISTVLLSGLSLFIIQKTYKK